MRVTWLVLLSVMVPAVWGYVTFWVIAKLWPPRLDDDRAAEGNRAARVRQDYQI